MRRLFALVPLAVLTAGTAVAVGLALSEAPGGKPPPVVAVGTTTTPTTRPHELHVIPDPGSTPIPAYCDFAYPSNKWPPPRDSTLDAHLLTLADMPAGMYSYPPLYPTNGPGFDDFAVGYPQDPITGIQFFVARSTEGFGVSELLGRARSSAEAAAQVAFAVDEVYGQCMSINLRQPDLSFALSRSEHSFIASTFIMNSEAGSGVGVLIFGSVGRYVFELNVGNSYTYPDTRTAPMPTQAQVIAVVQAATAHLG